MKKGLLYEEYLIKGRSVKYFLGYLENAKINVYKYKEIDDAHLKIRIDYIERNKFFAICKNMCYNIQKINYYGVLGPFYYIKRNIGLAIGIILFAFLIIFSNDYILDIDCVGSGNVFSSEIKAIAKDFGVDKFKRYSKIDVDGLQHKLLSTNANFSFVTIKKSGNRLIINTVLQKKEEDSLGKNHNDVVSPVEGIIESISVLRGTAIVSVGDSVQKGSVIIGAYILGKEDKIFPTYVVGRVSIIEEKIKTIKFNYIDEDSISKAIEIAKFNEDGEVVSSIVEVKGNDIEVHLKVRHIVIGG